MKTVFYHLVSIVSAIHFSFDNHTLNKMRAIWIGKVKMTPPHHQPPPCTKNICRCAISFHFACRFAFLFPFFFGCFFNFAFSSSSSEYVVFCALISLAFMFKCFEIIFHFHFPLNVRVIVGICLTGENKIYIFTC